MQCRRICIYFFVNFSPYKRQPPTELVHLSLSSPSSSSSSPMNNDAQEAAMGLLSLSPSNVPPPTPLVPLKRKHPPTSSNNGATVGSSSSSSSSGGGSTTVKRRPSSKLVHQSQPQPQLQVQVTAPAPEGDASTEAISCICGSSLDDGFSIACDDCSRWCHAACFDIVAGEVPEEWRCWVCVPRPVDRERAIRLQRARLGLRVLEEQAVPLETSTPLPLPPPPPPQQQQQQHQQSRQRKTSPGLERKHRRTSAAAIDGSKRKRRASFLIPPAPPHLPTTTEDDPDVVVDIDEPWSHSYVPITNDIVPTRETREKLTRHAQSWRGITALSSFPPTPPPPVAVHPLPHPPQDPGVRPPTYVVHTTAPVPSSSMIAPFTSSITPSSAYLSDPLNAYAHLGLPKPFVHLLGPPLDLALDARSAGGESRFVRSGCRPNAVLRPVLCRQPRREQGTEGEGDKTKPQPKPPEEDGTLAFAVFALRDLKANEEVVLGWEWDDGHAIHKLPALIQTPNMFPPAHQTHLRLQMSNILHLLSSTFPACACGAHARDCALRQMERFVDGLPFEDPRPPVQGDGDARGGSSSSSGYARRTEEGERRERGRRVDLGPLVGARRGFRTRERVEGSGGMGGVVMWDYDGERNEDRGEGSSTGRVRGRHPSVRGDADVEMVDAEETEDELEFQSNAWEPATTRSRARRHPQDGNLGVDDKPRRQRRHQHQHQHQHQQAEEPELRPPDPADVLEPDTEEKMPPKMRKRWIHREVEVRREAPVEAVGVETAVETGAGGGTWGWVDRQGKEGKEGDVVMEDSVVRERMGEFGRRESGGSGARGGVALEERRMEVEYEMVDAYHEKAAAPPRQAFASMRHTSSPPSSQAKVSEDVQHPLASSSELQAPPSLTLRPPLPHPELEMVSTASQPSAPYIQPKPAPAPSSTLPPPSTDSPSASFARLSLVSPIVSQLGRISTGVQDFEPGAPSPQVLQLLKGDLKGLVDLEGRDGGVGLGAGVEGMEDGVRGGETETTPIGLQTPSAFEDGAGVGDHDEGADRDTTMEDASVVNKGSSPISDLTTSSPLSPAAPFTSTSAASLAAEALSLASPPIAASPPVVVVVNDSVPPTPMLSSNTPDAPATLDAPIPRAVETYSPALPHVEAVPTRSPSAVEAIVETTVAVSTTFSPSSPAAATIAEETMHPTSSIVEASPTITLADGIPAISMDANLASPDTASSTGVPSVKALFSPIPPPSAPARASSPSPFLSPGVDTIRASVEPIPSEEVPKRTPTPSPMESPLPDTETLRPPTPPVIQVRTPTPPPAPKVKMSLKDYALRKQKRKEEEKAAGVNSGGSMSAEGSAAGSVEASPVVAMVGLLAEELERGTKEGAEDMVVEGRVNGIVVQGSGDGGAQTSPEVISPTVEQNEVPDDEDVEMVHYTPAVVLPPVTLPRPPPTTNALFSTTSLPSTSKSAPNPLLLPTYSRSPFLPENPNLRYRLITHAPTSARRRPGPFPRDQSSELLATSEAVPAAALPAVNPSPPLLRPLRHPPLSSSTPTPSTWRSPSMFGRPFTFQAKVELLDQPLPPKLPSNTGVHPVASQHRAQTVNGDTPNRSRPLSERIGPSTEPSPESTPRQHQDPQEEGEVSLGEETPSPQPAPRRIRIDRTRFAPTTVKSPPTGPRALRSASPHRRSFAVPMHQSPPPSSATPMPTSTTPAPPAARVPPTGPRAFRLGLGQQQQQPRVTTPQGWSTMQRELWGKPEWARSRPA